MTMSIVWLEALRMLQARHRIEKKWMNRAFHSHGWGTEGVAALLIHLGVLRREGRTYVWTGEHTPTEAAAVVQTWIVCLDDDSIHAAQAVLPIRSVRLLITDVGRGRPEPNRPWINHRTVIREHLRAHPGATPGEISTAEGIPLSTVRRALCDMVQRGQASRVTGGYHEQSRFWAVTT